MTTPTPKLPHVLAKDVRGKEQMLQVPEAQTRPGGPIKLTRRWDFDREGGTDGLGMYDPAEIVRNTLPLVPEATRIREGWQRLDGAAEGEPWGWADRYGRGWRRGEDGDLYYRSNTISSTYEAVERNQGPLTPLYAHPPVTAEPALVPEAANAREVITKWLARTEDARPVSDHANDLLVTLDRAGLTIVTAEPATAPLDPEALYVKHGWSGCAGTAWDEVAPAVREAWQCAARLLSEPAAAPSVEQIAEVLFDHDYERMECSDHVGQCCPADDGCHDLGVTQYAHWAEEIHALYGTPGDAGESRFNGKTLREMAHLAADLEERAEKAERERNDASARERNWAAQMERAESRTKELGAEVERYKAALEAAEAVIEALNYRFGSTVALQRARDDDDRAASMIRTAREKHRAARLLSRPRRARRPTVADPTRELMTAAADEVEAALQDACAAICEAMAEYQQKNGVTDAEVREALVRADFDSSHNHFREVGFASAWDDFERTEEAP